MPWIYQSTDYKRRRIAVILFGYMFMMSGAHVGAPLRNPTKITVCHYLAAMPLPTPRQYFVTDYDGCKNKETIELRDYSSRT